MATRYPFWLNYRRANGNALPELARALKKQASGLTFAPFGGLFTRPPPDGSPVRLGQLGLFWSTLRLGRP
jgi:hypothetical protein